MKGLEGQQISIKLNTEPTQLNRTTVNDSQNYTNDQEPATGVPDLCLHVVKVVK